MHLYSKRIAFVISEQSLIPAGGIGQFAKAFVDMAAKFNWIVDFVLDRPVKPNSDAAKFIESMNQDHIGRYYLPGETVYKEHQQIFAFTDAPNFDKEVNFRTAIWQALTTNMYDLIVCNVPESFYPVYATTIARWTKVLFYTHNENFVGLTDFPRIGPYSQEYDSIYLNALSLPHVYVGTQNKGNIDAMNQAGIGAGPCGARCKELLLLPLPYPDKELLEPYCGERSGVMFVGRWEERKDPQAFLNAVANLGLPVKILTNTGGAAKFTKALTALGVKDFEVKSNIIGKEKADFIRSAKMMYNPSKKESYGYSTFEALLHMPVLVEDYEWVKRIDHHNLHVVGKNETPEAKILTLYKEPHGGFVESPQEYIYAFWRYLVDSPFTVDGRQTASGNIIKKDNVFYHKHMYGLGRPASVEDMEPVYRAGYLFTRFYTKYETFLSKSSQVPDFKAISTVEDPLFS